MSFTAANSIVSFRRSAARRTKRPMRPNPLMPTRTKSSLLTEKDRRQLVEFAVDGFQGPDRFRDRHIHDFHPADRHHASEPFAPDKIDRLDAEPRAEKTIEGRRRPSALDVPEHAVAALESGLRLDA